VPKPKVLSHADIFFVDYTEWIFIHPDGTVTVHTGRIEMGQGLKTVISNVVSQGLRVAPDKLEIVMGDTGRCPDDGPTEGSGATRIIGWGHWAACARIRQDLLRRAGEKLGAPRDQLHHTEAGIRWPSEPDRLLTLADLVEDDGTVHLDLIDWRQVIRNNPPYTDRKTPAANARAIVTGGLQYVGDLFPGQCQYGAYLTPPYHSKVTSLESIDLEAARKVPGVVSVGRTGRKAIPSAFVVGETYTAVQNGLEAMNARWRRPSRPKTIDHEAEIRAGAKLLKTMEEAGDPKTGFAESGLTLAETYVTQPASQVPLETESAVALLEEGRMKVWASTQAPFKILPWIARRTGKPKEEVRVISMPVGGGFGCKVDTLAPEEAAEMARDTGCRVKHIYSRDHQFNGIGRYKDVVVADIASGVSPEGKILSRTLDLYQDEGHGSTVTYDIPHVRTRLFGSDMPVRHATMRGTSFVQTCFAVESHTDMLAEKAGLDPVAFRKMNLHTASFGPLLDACAEMLGYDGSGLGRGRGIGFAICHHGGRQLGAVGAEVSVNLKTGRVKVERLAGAFDIGVVVNINTLTSNTRGAMMWGLGYALFEEVELDGHRSYTRSLDHYRIPRFSDVPPIQLAFLDNEVHREGMPRGCGELPVIPTVGAIANGVYRAIGVRFRTLPLTPKRVKRAMAG
jgi:isoquinoline 1-oxidoreductase